MTLTGVETNTPVLSTLTKVAPQAVLVNLIQAGRGKEGIFAGSVSFEVQAYDSMTGRLLEAYVSKQYPFAENVGASLGALDAARGGGAQGRCGVAAGAGPVGRRGWSGGGAVTGARPVWAQALRAIGNAVRPDVRVTAAPEGVAVDWDVPVAVRDGTILRVNVFRPEAGAPAPVIMSAHPYGKDKIPAKTRSGRGVNLQYRLIPQPHPISISAWTGWEAPDPAVWVPRGYAVINADLRGAGTSEGIAELFSDQEALDIYDLIEWAGAQSWSSGAVGLDGVSYLAISQYKAAALRPPHLAAICPWEGLSDLYRDFARPGGVREDGFSILWSRMTGKAARVRTPIRAEIVRRPERDAWYAALAPALERIAVPMLVCGSFSDHCLHSRGSFEAFRRAGSARKWLYTHRDGKWSAYYGREATETRIRFFDHTLKGLDNGWGERAGRAIGDYRAGSGAGGGGA